jgi:ABC-type protease/lipase transport system fused ATPase/permease subunit
MIKKIIVICVLLIIGSVSLHGSEKDSWSQKDYKEYIEYLDKAIVSSAGDVKQGYIDLRDLIINAYRLGREHELDNCGDKQDKRDKKTNREKKESA